MIKNNIVILLLLKKEKKKEKKKVKNYYYYCYHLFRVLFKFFNECRNYFESILSHGPINKAN